MKEIRKSQFITDVTVTKMSRKELAAKYELPETEIKKIMKSFGLRISRKQHETYVIVDDVVLDDLAETTTSSTIAEESPVTIAPQESVLEETI